MNAGSSATIKRCTVIVVHLASNSTAYMVLQLHAEVYKLVLQHCAKLQVSTAEHLVVIMAHRLLHELSQCLSVYLCKLEAIIF